jgi:hypothetical protein
MKNLRTAKTLTIALLAIATSFTACQKGQEVETDLSSDATQIGAVAIAPTSIVLTTSNGSTTTTAPDSIYAVDACRRTHKRAAVAESALLAPITTYLSTNYAGYTFIKAFSTTLIATNTLDSYVVAILFNGKPVALRFSATGTFIKVLELREGKDMKRPGGHHPGGFFDNRDGKQRDSIALSALSQTIKQYFATNYPQDTLKNAWVGKDGGVLVVSKNVKFYGTAFKADGSFVRREVLPSHPGKEKEIAQSALPASVLSYLSTTYPNYVFKKAFEHKANGVLRGYLVIIDANMTKYAVLFNATGAFVEAKVIR